MMIATNATTCIRDVEDDDEFLALRSSQHSADNFANKPAANLRFGAHEDWNSDCDSDFETTSNLQQKKMLCFNQSKC